MTIQDASTRVVRTLPFRSAAHAVSVVLHGELAAAACAAAVVGTLGAENGGYFSTTWGWVAVPLFAFVALVLAVGPRRRLQRVELILLLSVAALSAWTFLSAAWSLSVTRSIQEGQRSLVLVAAVAAGLLVTRRAGGRALLVGVWLAILGICVYALLTRLFPRQLGFFDPIAGYQLSTPVGYWNGLAVLTSMGILVAVGLAARSENILVRAGAGASTAVLFPTLYFTFSRGGWVALIVGAIAAVAIDRRRLQLITTVAVLAPWSAIGIWYGSQAKALTHVDAPLSSAAADGHALAVILVGLVTLAGLAVVALDWAEANVHLPHTLERFYGGLLLFLLAAVLIVAFGRYGSPVTIARDSWDSFVASPSSTGPNLNNRLFHLTGNGRIDHWRVALTERSEHPWLGSGAGTFGEVWFRDRPSTVIVHDAHNLYLETLAELGPVGLGLLAVLLGAPLALAVLRRRSPFTSVAVGAFVAFVVHAAVDWDWELPVIVVAALFTIVAVLGEPAARPEPAPGRRRSAVRIAPAAAAAALGGFSLFGLLGNLALASSGQAADAGNWRSAASEARDAQDLQPWATEPLRKLAVAEAGAGNRRTARSTLEEAVRMEPDDWSLWFQLARVSSGSARRHADAEAARLNPRRTDREASFDNLAGIVEP